MISMPFSITVDYPFWPEEGCVHVVAMPHVIIYRIPRNHTADLAGYEDMKKAGIYLLVNTEKRTLYVGQADSRDNGNGILARMLEPHKQKAEIDSWDVGYALICAVPNLFGATELNYLERYFYDTAKAIGRYTLLNGSRPHATGVNNYTQNNLNSFIPPALFLLERHIGFDAYVPISPDKPAGKAATKADSKKLPEKTVSEIKKQESKKQPDKKTMSKKTVLVKIPETNHPIPGLKLILAHKKYDVYAVGYLQDGNRIIVLPNSRISYDSKLAGQKGRKAQHELREELCQDGTIIDRIFTEEYSFSSPSNAATVILGTSASGNMFWKTENGVTLGEYLKGDTLAETTAPKYHMTSRGSDAYGIEGPEGTFIVLKGSKIAQDVTATFKKRTKDKFRNELVEKGIIKDFVFTCDWKFDSISAAASIVSGHVMNGKEAWEEC